MGDMDGRERVTRLGQYQNLETNRTKLLLIIVWILWKAEEIYHTENYLTIIEGMNLHTPFYQEGKDLEWMKEGDLVAEKSAEECLDEIVEYSGPG